MLHYSDEQLRGLIPINDAVAALEAAFAAYARGEATAQPRHTIGAGLEISTMSAILPGSGYCAAKVYTRRQSQYSFVVLLFDASTGQILATLDAGELTKLRTAAVSGIAARRMARANPRHLAIFGSGRQAAAHLDVLPKMFDLHGVDVVSRGDAGAFCDRMSKQIGITVTQAA